MRKRLIRDPFAPATSKQVAYLRSLNPDADGDLTKREASEEIEYWLAQRSILDDMMSGHELASQRWVATGVGERPNLGHAMAAANKLIDALPTPAHWADDYDRDAARAAYEREHDFQRVQAAEQAMEREAGIA